jgi:membrane fusion protein (multidrug efflux system)
MSQPLTTISDNQEMYVYFSMTENQLRGLVQQYGSPDEAIAKMPPVKLELSDGSSYESEGRIKSISGIVDPQTGTVSVCSVFPNKRKWLWSGGIGNIVISLHKSHAIVVPLGVVGELQDKLYAFKVVGGKAVRVFISITKLSDGKSCIVHSGLRSGDTVVTEGGGLLKNGMPIKIKTNLSEQK